MEEPPPPPPEPVEPKGPMYTIAELVSRVIDARNSEDARVTYEQMYGKIVKGSPEAAATKIQSIHRGKKARAEVEQKKAATQAQSPGTEKKKKKARQDEEPSKPKGILGAKTNVSLALNFKYFESEQGLRFLLENGQLDPESRSAVDSEKIM